MKLIAIVAAICALSQAAIAQAAIAQAAIAQTADCKLVADATARLACYDKAAPRAAPAIARPIAAVPKQDDGKYVDTISAEDALMNARLKNICRGC